MAEEVLKLQREYDERNRIAAEVVLSNPARFEGSGLWQWAQLWRRRHPDAQAPVAKPAKAPATGQQNLW